MSVLRVLLIALIMVLQHKTLQSGILKWYYYYYQFYHEGRHTQKAKPVQGVSPKYNITKTTKKFTKLH